MSHERVTPEDPHKAIAAYTTAIPLINDILPEIQRAAATPSAQAITPTSDSFAKFRELWCWTERLLRRAIILTAHYSDPAADDGRPASFWSLQSLYRACSAHWPAAFRPESRATVATLHLRAFVLRAQRLSPDALRAKAPRWISHARSVLQELRALLSVCTCFPRAGERNTRVEDFVDLCVALWEADGAVGEYAGWVIDVSLSSPPKTVRVTDDHLAQFLWWATRLTFNSYRIYRHMFRLLAASGDPELAKRTLRLYVQVVSKAHEAGNSQGGASPTEGPLEWDTDRQWVQTLVQGAKMLCRLAVQEPAHGKAVELAREAGAMIQKAKVRLDGEDKEAVASVQLAEGIWYSVTAHAGKLHILLFCAFC